MLRASAVVPFVDFLETAGAPAERLLEDVRLSPRVLENPESLLPLFQCLSFGEHLARKLKLADVGLVVGQRTRFDQLGALARIFRGAQTLHEALNRFIGAITLYNSGERMWLECDGERVLFCHRYNFSGVPGQRQGELFALAMMIEAVRAVLGPRWIPDEVRLPQTEEPNRMRDETMLGVPVVCEDRRSHAIVFARALLAARPMTCRPAPNGPEDGYELLRATAPAEDFAGSVRQTIETLLRDGYPDIRQTAEAVGLSARTLQRRLAETGESYHHLVDSVRLDAGIKLLGDGDTRLVDIAAELGYENQANFTRAFRRLTGMPPRAFRRAQSFSPGNSASVRTHLQP
jgi:AraC-like DNA-binding protein